MTVVAVASVRSSPGATTLATGLAFAEASFSEKVLLVEADPSGGVLALRFGLEASPNLLTFAADTRSTFSEEKLWENTQDMRGVHCLAGPADPKETELWVAKGAETLAAQGHDLAVPVIVDLGRVSTSNSSIKLVKSAEMTVLVTRPELAEVQALVCAVQTVKDAGGNPMLVCVGDRPYDPDEVASVAKVPLLGIVPDQPALASVLCGYGFNPRKFERSLYWRSILDIHNRVLPPPALDQQQAAAPAPPIEHLTQSEGSPPCAEVPAQHSASYVLIGAFGRREFRTLGPITIGRSSTCDLQINDPHLSRVHCQIHPTDEGYVLSDANSTNGIRVNDISVTRHVLTRGDRVRIGHTTVTFDSHPSEKPQRGATTNATPIPNINTVEAA